MIRRTLTFEPHHHNICLNTYEVTMIGITKTPIACYTVPAKSSTGAVEVAMAIHQGLAVLSTTVKLISEKGF